MRARVALIGGTGIGQKLAMLGGEPTQIETPYGPVPATECDFEGTSLLILQRHGSGHKVPPHRVNYRAMASALQAEKVPFCLASAAVGSLRIDWGKGVFAICSDFLDLTFRQLTMHDDQVVHTDFTEPFDPRARHAMIRAAERLNLFVHHDAVYVCGNGPRYETPAEVRMMRALGGDVVGMTAATEAILMREVGIGYGCIAVVTNVGTGLGGEMLHHGEVVDVMEEHGQQIADLMLESARMLSFGD